MRYLASDPNHKRLLVEGEEGTAGALALAVLVSCACGFALYFGWREIGPLLRKKRVLARGQPAGAIVVSVSREKKRAKVRYRFLDRSGAVVEGTDRVAGASFFGRQIVTVLYEEDKPRHSMIYPSPVVRIARVDGN